MTEMFNRVSISGTVAAEPVLRYTADQRPVCEVLIKQTGRGEDGREPYSVSVWSDAAVRLSEEAAVGDFIAIVDGKLKSKTWKERTGAVRHGVDVYAWGYWLQKAAPVDPAKAQPSPPRTQFRSFADRSAGALEQHDDDTDGRTP